MRKLVDFICSVSYLGLVLALVIALIVCIGINAHKTRATENAVQQNVSCILQDQTSKDAYELLRSDDWEGFKETYGLRPTYYTVGDEAFVSLVSDNMMETIIIYAGSAKSTAVEAFAVQGYGEHWENFDINEGCSLKITVSGHPVNFTPSGAATLCQILSRLTAGSSN